MKLTSFGEVLTRLESLDDRPGRGWALAHCAQSIEFAVRGFPTQKPALFQKTIGRLVLSRFLKRGAMSHDLGAAIPGAPAIDPATPLAEGAGVFGPCSATKIPKTRDTARSETPATTTNRRAASVTLTGVEPPTGIRSSTQTPLLRFF